MKSLSLSFVFSLSLSLSLRQFTSAQLLTIGASVGLREFQAYRIEVSIIVDLMVITGLTPTKTVIPSHD